MSILSTVESLPCFLVLSLPANQTSPNNVLSALNSASVPVLCKVFRYLVGNGIAHQHSIASVILFSNIIQLNKRY